MSGDSYTQQSVATSYHERSPAMGLSTRIIRGPPKRSDSIFSYASTISDTASNSSSRTASSFRGRSASIKSIESTPSTISSSASNFWDASIESIHSTISTTESDCSSNASYESSSALSSSSRSSNVTVSNHHHSVPQQSDRVEDYSESVEYINYFLSIPIVPYDWFFLNASGSLQALSPSSNSNTGLVYTDVTLSQPPFEIYAENKYASPIEQYLDPWNASKDFDWQKYLTQFVIATVPLPSVQLEQPYQRMITFGRQSNAGNIIPVPLIQCYHEVADLDSPDDLVFDEVLTELTFNFAIEWPGHKSQLSDLLQKFRTNFAPETPFTKKILALLIANEYKQFVQRIYDDSVNGVNRRTYPPETYRIGRNGYDFYRMNIAYIAQFTDGLWHAGFGLTISSSK